MKLTFLIDGYLLLLSTFIGPVAAMLLSMKFISNPTLIDNKHKVVYMILGVLLTYLFMMIYCLPIKIARYRNHSQFKKISLINYILAPTGVFWLVALVWSLSGN